MSFVRPEAMAFVRLWSEALIGAAVVALGLYWAVFSGGLLQWIGYVVVVIGFALLLSGIQRGRFKTGRAGPGVVTVEERRIVYFGPLSGGVMDLDQLDSLLIDPSAKPPHWVLHSSDGQTVQIPLGAKGADALFDAFAQLPDLNTEHLLRRMKSDGDQPVVIWRSAALQNSTKRLH